MTSDGHPLIGRYVFAKTGADLLGRVVAVGFHPRGVFPEIGATLQAARSSALDTGAESFPRLADGEARVTAETFEDADITDGRGCFVLLVEARDGLFEEHPAVHCFVDDARLPDAIARENEEFEKIQ